MRDDSASYRIFPRYGYTSRLHVPAKTYTRSVEFRHSEGITRKNANKPTGMRVVDIGILAEVFSNLRCSECNGTLILYEEENSHGWQSFFRIKCQKCHLQHANFPSSRYMDSNNNEPCVNVPFRPSAMNEVTMRSVLATHSTGISWQSLHKIATVFDMITPLQTMPSRYVTRLEEATDKAVKTSMIEAANELHQRVDRVISPEPGAINITVSFDSFWKTRGFYSNIGFGAVISTNTKKVLDYEILSRLCELCSIWNEDKQKEQPLEYQSWLKRHKPNCNKNFTGSSQAMEPEAAERIWSRSLERNLVYSVYVGDGDGKGFLQVTSLNPYPLVVVRKEECLTHVAKRLKRTYRKLKPTLKRYPMSSIGSLIGRQTI